MSAVTMGYLRFHWEGPYRFAEADGKFTATAAFGSHDVLEAGSPAELLAMVRRHYPGPVGERSST
jgi:hypothetical protein